MTRKRRRVLRPRATTGRLEWLRAVANDATAKRQRGSVGYDCMQLGWTQWRYDADGNIGGEELTDTGRAILLSHSEDLSDD